MYKLEIDSWLATVTVQSTDFAYISDIESAVKAVREKYENAREKDYLVPKTFVAKQPAKKRGRPAGSRNKK